MKEEYHPNIAAKKYGLVNSLKVLALTTIKDSKHTHPVAVS